MSLLTLGMEPDDLNLVLTTGADFVGYVDYYLNGVLTNWPGGAALTLEFDDASSSVWTATAVTSRMTWNVDKAVADAMPAQTVVRVRYLVGTVDLIPYVGTVARRG